MKVALALVCGAICGSFAAAVADRFPRGESVATGRSQCRSCGSVLIARDLVPILSWVALRGRCRVCREVIGASSTVIESLGACVFALCAVFIEHPLDVLAHWILCTGLIALSVIDIRTFRLPRRIVHTTAALVVIIFGIASISTGDGHRLVAAAVGAVSAFLAMFVLYVASRGRLGDGDVRLSALIGLALGWHGPSAVWSGLLLSFHLGALGGLAAMAVSRSMRSRAIPFGPYLALGTVLTFLFDVDLVP